MAQMCHVMFLVWLLIQKYLCSFRDGDKMAPSVEKKIAELEMGLLHLQQNIEIPEISLPIHATITNVAKQCYERGEKPKVTDFGEKAEDPLFLNQLQSGVNRWIREIQKVDETRARLCDRSCSVVL